MTVTMPFKDSVTIYERTPNDYGRDVRGEAHEMAGAFEQVTDYGHAGSQDFTASSSILFLPDGEFVQSVNYRLDEMIAVVNGITYKITQSFPVRDTLLGNKVRHIECSLKKISAVVS